GNALATDGRREAARAPLHEAHVLATELGASEVVDQAARTLRAVGGRPPAETGGPHGLTASELRVAQLAARGRTNRQIADELVVSPHTVRFHLSGVYRKLGVTAREEIAGALDGRAPAG
ncbi:MAG TPA: helix-turn-helix transcriptional regulator, partial [Solirubrobacteraceae bacterium]|nr:helix-turn-helix transcriptional regulator [Solirubrobacteraceae bacterium]